MMALKQPDSVFCNDASAIVDGGKMLVAAVLLLAVVIALGLRTMVSLDALAPVVATLLFGSAAVAGGVGLLLRRDAPQTRLIDIAGILTFVGVIVSIAIEPDQMTRLMALSEQPD